MQPFFSLILPCYNVEAYVERCVRSILEQDFEDYEIILVDDGATDGTPAICDALAQQEPRIRVIHKENGGLSSARNAGLDIARGKYIWFIDSDDWIEPSALIQIYQACCDGEPDIVKFAHYRMEKEKKTVLLNVGAGLYRSQEQIAMLWRKALCEAGRYSLSSCMHVYKRDFLAMHRFGFVSERLIGSEDYLFNLQTLMRAQTLTVLANPLYTYEKRSGSLTQTYKPDLPERYAHLHQLLRESIRSDDHPLADRFYIWHLVMGTCVSCEYSQGQSRGSLKTARVNVRRLLKDLRVKNAARRSDRKGLGLKKSMQLAAILFGFEPLFYYLYVVKPHRGLTNSNKE